MSLKFNPLSGKFDITAPDLSAHTTDTQNPHQVTATQTGAVALTSPPEGQTITGGPLTLRGNSTASNIIEFFRTGNSGNPNGKIDGYGDIYFPLYRTTFNTEASNVAYGPSGNSETGLYFPLSNTIGLSTTGVERFRVDSDGNVGIGTTSPASKLHAVGKIRVDGAATDAYVFEIDPANGAGPMLNLAYTGTIDTYSYFKLGAWASRNNFYTNDRDLKFFRENGSGYGNGDGFILKADTGNIGIATDSPSSKLTVAGTIETTTGGVKFPDGTIQVSAGNLRKTYAELAAMIADPQGGLSVGQTYVLTDFYTKYKQPVTDTIKVCEADASSLPANWDSPVAEGGHAPSQALYYEPIILTATSATTFSELAKSETYPDHELIFDFTNTTVDTDVTRRGWIKRRTDKVRNISIPCDYKRIVVPRYCLDKTSVPSYNISGVSYTAGTVVRGLNETLELILIDHTSSATTWTNRTKYMVSLFAGFTAVIFENRRMNYKARTDSSGTYGFSIPILASSKRDFWFFSDMETLNSTSETSDLVRDFAVYGDGGLEIPNTVINTNATRYADSQYRCESVFIKGGLTNTTVNTYMRTCDFGSMDDCIISQLYNVICPGDVAKSNLTTLASLSVSAPPSTNEPTLPGFNKNEGGGVITGGTIQGYFGKNIITKFMWNNNILGAFSANKIYSGVEQCSFQSSFGGNIVTTWMLWWSFLNKASGCSFGNTDIHTSNDTAFQNNQIYAEALALTFNDEYKRNQLHFDASTGTNYYDVFLRKIGSSVNYTVATFDGTNHWDD